MFEKRFLPIVLLFAVSTGFAAEPGHRQLKDPYFGEALFYAREGNYFDAIARLDAELTQYYGVDEPRLDTLHYHINRAEFSVGDFELSYRMHRRAGRAIKAVIEGDVPAAVRNEALYRLARIYFQKEQNLNALHTIQRITGEVPAAIEDDVAFLTGQIFLATGKFADAERVFASLEKQESYKGFAAYNLGVALYAQGRQTQALEAFDRAGREDGNDKAQAAIRDKSNLVLGRQLLEEGQLQAATQYLDRVRLEGPFSNKALLELGWADVKLGHYERALVPWRILIGRNLTDASVQEALVGVPYAYGKLGMYGRSAVMYGNALGEIDEELNRLTASIESINEGNFLEALVREEIHQDEGWVVRLRELPRTPETWYLMDLMASHDFQSCLQNYLDLEELRRKLASWDETYDAFEEMIAIRRRYYEPLLPSIDAQFRKLDSRMRLRVEQRDMLSRRLQSMLIAPNPDFLATADERIVREKLAAIEQAAHGDAGIRHRVDRLEGYLLWNIRTAYDERLTAAFKHLDELDEDVARLEKIYASFVRTRQAATQSYEGYDEPLRRLRRQTKAATAEVNTLLARQGHMLETMAVNELVRRRQRLESAQVKARFAMAESYDRATMEGAVAKTAKSPSPNADAEVGE